MIAEIYGKMADSNIDRNQRLEDELTGNVFGTLRYMPYSKGFKKILECVKGQQEEEIREVVENIVDEKPCVSFWDKRDWGEIDVHIETEGVSINIEVKYHSPESGDDQLSRYSHNIVAEWGKGKKCIMLILTPAFEAEEIYNDKINNKQINSLVTFGYLSWEDIYDVLLEIKSGRDNLNSEYTYFEMSIIEDIVAFLKRRELDGFRGFRANESIERDKFYDFKLPWWDFEGSVKKEDYYEFKRKKTSW